MPWLLCLASALASIGVRAAAPDCAEVPAAESTSAMAGAGEGEDVLPSLASLARDALAQSAEVRGAQHGSRAARFDLDQTAAAARPAIGLSSGLGLAQSAQDGATRREGRTSSLALSVTAPLYDGGRLDALVQYRQRMAEAGEVNIGSVRERVVREAVVTVLERNRYTAQVAVHDRHVAKMACLVRMMEQVVELDRGRSSELTQARVGLRQAQLVREDALTARRQAQTRLQQLVGGPAILPWSDAGRPLQDVPALAQVVDEMGASPDVQQLRLQAEAMLAYARASRAETAPQLRWQAGTSQSRAVHADATSWNAGLTLNLTLADGGAAMAGSNAAAERALAARRQEEALIEERIRTATALHDAAVSARTRTAQITEVLKDSEQVRSATYAQWARLGRRSLFDLISAEAEHMQLRLAEVNAQHDAWAAVAQMRSAGAGLLPWLAPELAPVGGR
ncbi:TolC family protein [Sphaerotilus sp.]|uniref:TolC family protein n=1 Tax=Sphaerotilus sp. TaxID=2093942 RepID=UPI002ACE1D87|nr:TolC family protein [Sphaerotilus sp.]MDZ7858031.1 TolC family protein [Sphaerotilus sp.]